MSPRRRLAASLSALALIAVPAVGLPAADPVDAAACRTQSSSVMVELSRGEYPGSTDHIADAQAAGQPSLLHIDRVNADRHRDESLEGIPTKAGYDRDEYPPAMSAEGGYGADVRYVESSDNRGAGSSMGNQLEEFCNGQPFRFSLTP